MRHPSKVYVVDTNALLNDPEVIYAFSGAEVVIPAVVLRELDELKRKRTDSRVLYHGRKATRLLFEVSQNGRLLNGIVLDNGSLLRVDPTEEFEYVPGDLDLTRPDDLIIALAYSLDSNPGVQATLVTNDLNMLLRAEALGLAAYRFEGKLEQLRERGQSPMEWLRKRRWTAALGFLACLFFATTIYLYATRAPNRVFADLPAIDQAVALRSLGMSEGEIEQHFRERIKDDRNDFDALVGLAKVLLGQGEEFEHFSGQGTPESRQKFLEASEFLRRALEIQPQDANLRTDLGITLLKVGRDGDALKALQQAILDDPENPWAHYNLGVAYLQVGMRDGTLDAGERGNTLSSLSQFLALAKELNNPALPVLEAQQIVAELEGGL